MLKVSENLIISIDISNGEDVSVMQVGRYSKGTLCILNTFYGEEAEQTYNMLISRPTTINDKGVMP